MNRNEVLKIICEARKRKKIPYLRGVDLRGIDLSDAGLHEVDFTDANFTGADLSGADLSDANLRWADMSEANLCGANLMCVNLYSTNLHNVNFAGANLCMANLCQANLTGADLSSANLTDANFTGAYLYEAKLPDANPNEKETSSVTSPKTRCTPQRAIAREIAHYTAREIDNIDMRLGNISRFIDKLEYLDDTTETSEIEKCINDAKWYLEESAKMLDNMYNTQTTKSS